jgi:hypothetical protein
MQPQQEQQQVVQPQEEQQQVVRTQQEHPGRDVPLLWMCRSQDSCTRLSDMPPSTHLLQQRPLFLLPLLPQSLRNNYFSWSATLGTDCHQVTPLPEEHNPTPPQGTNMGAALAVPPPASIVLPCTVQQLDDGTPPWEAQPFIAVLSHVLDAYSSVPFLPSFRSPV